MLSEIFKEAWAALGRNPVRSLLTMTGISWGIVAVTLLLSYGSGFRNVLMYTFEALPARSPPACSLVVPGQQTTAPLPKTSNVYIKTLRKPEP